MRVAAGFVFILLLPVLAGCAYLPWPRDDQAAPSVTPPPVAEEIGPRVEAVPVEPVVAEDLLQKEAAPATVPDEPL